MKHLAFFSFCVVISCYAADGDSFLSPVDGTIGRWNVALEKLESHANTPAGFVTQTLLFCEYSDDKYSLVLLGKRNSDEDVSCYLVTSAPGGALDARALGIVPKELSKIVHAAVMNELLLTRYDANAGRQAVLDGTNVYVGATDTMRPYMFFMGKCHSSTTSLAWIEQLSKIFQSLEAKPDWPKCRSGIEKVLKSSRLEKK